MFWRGFDVKLMFIMLNFTLLVPEEYIHLKYKKSLETMTEFQAEDRAPLIGMHKSHAVIQIYIKEVSCENQANNILIAQNSSEELFFTSSFKT